VNKAGLIGLLSAKIPTILAEDLVDEFLQLRADVASRTLGRSSSGKFVETLVQILQQLETGAYDAQPNVDAYLRGLESKNIPMDDGLRICAARVGRAMYTFRNKRNILHKGAVDPNEYDLQFLHAAAQWVMAELVRQTTGTNMSDAGALIAQVQAPVGGIVEDFSGKTLVHGDLKAPDEVLIVLHARHPDSRSREDIYHSIDRKSADTVRKALSALWRNKLVEQLSNSEFKLTHAGLRKAIEILRKHTEN